MKKTLALVSILMAALLLCGCATGCAHGFLTDGPSTSGRPSSGSSTPASSQVYGSTADYTQVLQAARPEELNSLEMYNVVTGPDDGLHQSIFDPSTGFVESDMQRYAISMGMVITLAYGVAIILPVPGHEQAVIDQLQAYVEQQQKAMENYLQPQYEIAKAAIIDTAPTGEVLLAMCEDAGDVMRAMKEGLAAG